MPIDPDDDYSDLLRLRATSQGESFNRQANILVAFVTAQSAELGDAKLWLRITRYNLDKDKKLAKHLKIQKPRGLYWYIHKALFRVHRGFSVHDDMEFPPELPSW